MIEAFVEGNIGKEPELKSGNQGPFVTFSIASSEKKDTPPTWVNVACFSQSLQEKAAKLEKGSKVRVYGRLVLKEYNGKSYLNLTAESIRTLYSRPKDNQLSGEQKSWGQNVVSEAPIDLTDVPF